MCLCVCVSQCLSVCEFVRSGLWVNLLLQGPHLAQLLVLDNLNVDDLAIHLRSALLLLFVCVYVSFYVYDLTHDTQVFW